jgi:Iron-containing redox enzyme
VTALPEPRGALTDFLLEALARPAAALPAPPEPGGEEDLQLALYLCYELHYRGLPGADDRWEWEPSLIALRGELERRFEAALRRDIPVPRPDAPIDLALREIEAADEAPSLSRHLEREGTLDEYLEFAVHRSAYQLKEADPHSWALPRLSGGPKAALVEIQADEYGGGDPRRIHAALFAAAMDALGLDSRYGAYVDHLPAVTLATVNLMSMFGLHRRLLGAIVGHLAMFEMTSSIPNRRYGTGLRRLGFSGAATEFYDEHVVADAVHENVAAVDLAGGLARQDPRLTGDILWGAAALIELEGRFARHLLGAWEAGERSLRRPIEPRAGAAGSAASPAARAH